MRGATIVGTLLRAYAPLTALVDPANIKGGRLPSGVTLPALLVRNVSLNDQQVLKPGARQRSVARVAVTVRAASHRDRSAVLRLVRQAVRGFTGSAAGASRVSITTAGQSPEMDGPADSFEQTQDFRVSFDEPA